MEYRVVNEELGRKTHGNPVSLPSGSARICDNFETFRPNVYRKTRGRYEYSKALGASLDASQLLAYNDRLLVHYTNGELYYDTNGILTYVGTYQDPYTDYKIKELEFNSNLYFTSLDGVQKLDAITGTPVVSGTSRGFSPDLRLVNDVNWLPTVNRVAYKIVWYYQDGNKNYVTGTPSDRAEITNTALVDMAVELNIQTIPEATVDYTFQIYRSSYVVAAATPPEDFQLVYEAKPTATEIANGFIVINDVMPDDFKGAFLYTNPTVEGISQSNDRPPRAGSLDKYRSYVFYGNTENLQRLNTNLIATDGLVGASLYIYDSTYTAKLVTATADNGGLIEITTFTAHGLTTNDYVFITGVTGTTLANGSWRITRINATRFTLQGSGGWVAWTGGGNVYKAIQLEERRYDTNVAGTGIAAVDTAIASYANNGGIIRVTTNLPHGLATFDYVRIYETAAMACPNAIGCWLINVIGPTVFDLTGSTWGGGTDTNGTIDLITNRGAGIASIADNGAGDCRFATNFLHGLDVNDFVNIYDVTGTPLANGIHRVTTVSDTTHFDIDVTFVATSTGSADLYEQIAGDLGHSLVYFRHTTGTDAQNIDLTARSIVRTINRGINNDFIDAYYISGVDDPVGKIELVSRSLGLDYFYMFTLTAAASGNFTPALPTTFVTDYQSENDAFPHALMYSKDNQPEAVPLLNIEFIGNKSDPIWAVIGLKDSVFIIKPKDGIYRLTGNTPASFIITAFDTTVQCLSKDSIAKGENSIFMFTNLGYVRISDSGTELIGSDNLFNDLIVSKNANIGTTYGWFSENEHTYYVSTHEFTTDTDNAIINAYNTVTQSWYRVRQGVTTNDPLVRCGKIILNTAFTAALTGDLIYKERKDFAVTDYATPDIDINIINIDIVNNTILLFDPITIPLESVVIQVTGGVTYRRTVVARLGANEYELVNVNNLVNGVALIRPGVNSVLEYQQCHCGTPEYGKTFRKTHILFDSDETDIKNIIATTYTDADKTERDISFAPLPGNFWGLIWSGVWGLSKLLDRWLFENLREHQNGSIIWIKLTHRVPEEQAAICGYSVIYEVNTERTRY